MISIDNKENQLPTNRIPTTDYNLQDTCYGLPTTKTVNRLPVTDDNLQFTERESVDSDFSADGDADAYAADGRVASPYSVDDLLKLRNKHQVNLSNEGVMQFYEDTRGGAELWGRPIENIVKALRAYAKRKPEYHMQTIEKGREVSFDEILDIVQDRGINLSQTGIEFFMAKMQKNKWRLSDGRSIDSASLGDAVEDWFDEHCDDARYIDVEEYDSDDPVIEETMIRNICKKITDYVPISLLQYADSFVNDFKNPKLGRAILQAFVPDQAWTPKQRSFLYNLDCSFDLHPTEWDNKVLIRELQKNGLKPEE